MALPFFNKRGTGEKQEMSFIDHLEELRWHIVRSLLAVIIMAIVIFAFQDFVVDYIIMGPMNKNFITYNALCDFSKWAHMGDALCIPPPAVSLQGTTFGTQFMSSITIAFVGGFILAFPYVFYEVWRFIKPALNSKELQSARGGIFWVSLFFFTGAAFGYFVLAPFTFSFLANFKLGTQVMIETKPTIADYIENLTNIILGTGIAFQLPIVSYVLTRIGLITPKFLRTYRKYALVAILMVAAIITPSPDWMSQMIVFTPLFLLYELGIVISSRVHKKNLQRDNNWD
ncbi:MAG: twin-arginine translocase subunit TatC [Chitinophagaceae bacterium]|nr:twin-arginine translocase subunit TatC [Chitinophagaceae bacterium]